MLRILLLLLTISLSLAISGYLAQNQSAAKMTQDQLLLDYSEFTEKIESLNKFATSKNIRAIKDTFISARLAYKKIEYLVSYIDRDYSERYFNGIPIPKPEPNSPSASVLEPEGFQPLEELIYDDNPEFDRIVDLSGKLYTAAKRFKLVLKSSKLYDRHIFEAMRFGILRIMSLGLSGFDSPYSDKAIIENQVSMEALAKTWERYSDDNPNNQTVKEVKQLFVEANKSLAMNTNFETFDRLHFIREYINPIFAKLYDSQIELNIEFQDEVSSIKQAVNFRAKEIFSTDFLNKYYYMNLSKRDDTKELQILGKTLFFDPILSANNKRACASCHDPKKAFTDGKAKSISFNFEGTVERNSPTLMNSVYSDRFFYDLRAQKLEDQVDHVITSSKEFDTDYTKIIDKLSSNSEYVAMFRKAYPHINSSKIVNKYTITTALAAYVGNLVSFDSDFDKYIRKEISEIDSSVIRGYNLFAGKALCGTCHFTPTFNGTVPPFFIETDSENLGVTVSSNLKQPVLDTDLGRAKGLLKDRLEIFNHSFKTLTIRNIELTAPYMHNGAFKTLEEVLEFYNEGGGMGLGLDNPYQTLPDDKLNLTKQEKADIIAFMKSLTDNPKVEVPTLPKYQNIDRVAGGEY